MKTKIQWLPTSLYFTLIISWINGSVDKFLRDDVSITVLWLFRILGVYTILLVMITFYYWLIKNELNVEREKRRRFK